MGLKLAVLGYLKQSNKTLMLFRNKKKNDMHKGKWNGLGGKLEKGESPEEALQREVKEEANVELLDYQLKGIITFPNFDLQDDWYVYIYTSNKFKFNKGHHNQVLNYPSPEGELHWIEDEKILDLTLWEGDRLFLKWIKKNIFFSAKIVYKNKKLISHQVKFYSSLS